MQNCPRCGQQVYPNTPSCPRCGLALAPYAAGGASAEPPDWMRQVRPGIPPVPAPGYGPPGQTPGGAAPYGQAAGEPAGNLPVGSLISEDALPEWMRQPGGGGVPAAPRQGGPSAPWGAGAPNWPPQAGVPAAPPGMGLPPAPAPGYSQQSPAGPSFDESALPPWMRQAPVAPDIAGQATMYGPAPTPGYPPAQPGGPFPPIGQAGAGAPRAPGGGAGMAAQSLLDASAVPNWLTGEPGPPTGPGDYGGPQAAGDGLSAQVLIDERALPQWLRTEADTPAAPVPGTSPGTGPGTSVAQWLTSSATEERPPAWLDQMYAGAQVPPAPAPQPGAPLETMAARQGTLPAGQFVDDSVLPAWLRAQGASEAPPTSQGGAMPESTYGSTGRVPAPAGNAWGAPGPGPTGMSGQSEHFSAVDLVDQGAMPAWLGGEQMPQQPGMAGSAGGAGASAQPAGAPAGQLADHELPPWLRGGPPPAVPPSQWQGHGGGGLPGGEWGGQQWGDGYAQEAYPPANGYPPQPPYAPPAGAGWGVPAGPSAYPGYGEQGGYDEYQDYADYGGYDPNGYGYAEDQPPQPPSQQGGWRRIFRRK